MCLADRLLGLADGILGLAEGALGLAEPFLALAEMGSRAGWMLFLKLLNIL